MPSLLSIPREIRDSIIELVLSSVREAHSNAAEAQATRCSKKNLGRPGFKSWGYGPANVHFETEQSYLTNSLPLFLVNHQFLSETTSAVSRLSTSVNPPPYELDVMLINENELWPTWLSVPALSKQLDQVNVTFRSFGCNQKSRSAFQGGDGSPPQITWCFYYLMEYVLRQGPRPRAYSFVDREVSINNLNLNFVGSTGEPHEGDRRYTKSETDNERQLRPEWLARFIGHEIISLLEMGYYVAAFGAILHERIGSIRISVNGEQIYPINIGDILSKLSYTNPSDTFGDVWPREKRIPTFLDWKRNAYLIRERYRLPVHSEVVKD